MVVRWAGPEARPAGFAGAAPRALPSLPPSHCEGPGIQTSAAVTRPSCPITGLYQSEAGRRGRADGHCSATPVPALAPPRVSLTCPGRRQLPQLPRVNHSPRPHFRGPQGPPAGCDSPPTSGSGSGAHTARPATALGTSRSSESPHWPPLPDTLSGTRDHTHGKAHGTPPGWRTPRPSPSGLWPHPQEGTPPGRWRPGPLGRVRLRRSSACFRLGRRELAVLQGSAWGRFLEAAQKAPRGKN